MFGSTGISVLVHALCHSSNLSSLDLGNVHINELTAESLHDKILKNIFLQKLYLDNCNFSQKCFKLLAESLKETTSLKVFSFAGNNMLPCTSDLVSVLETNSQGSYGKFWCYCDFVDQSTKLGTLTFCDVISEGVTPGCHLASLGSVQP